MTDSDVEACVQTCGADQNCVDLCNDEAACLAECNESPPDCYQRECRPKQPLGGACVVRSDCQSDACSDDGVCMDRGNCD